ncbi:hypothetical protein Tco_0528238 [Tanacetum coccineum]
MNPTIYTSCIKQFWATAKAKSVNEEVQIQALVDGKKVISTETSREGKGFSGRVTPLFQTMMVQAPEELGEGSEIPPDPQHTPTINQPSSSQPLKKQKPRKTKKQNTKVSQSSDPTQPMADETENVESVPIHSNDPLLSGLKRLRKVGRFAQVVSSKDEGLGAQEDASKQGRKIVDLDVDVEEVEVEKVVSTAEVTTASTTTTTVDELTLAQALIEIKAAKPKAVITAATTTITTITRPKARGAKYKGKAKMMEPEKPLKKKDQILVDEEIAQRLQEELQAELEEEERLARQKEEEDNLIS